MIKEKFRVSTDILSRLIANRLLRVEPRLNGFYYELSHDNLVAPIKLSSKNRKLIGGLRLALVIAVIAVIAFIPSFKAFQHAADLENANTARELGNEFASINAWEQAILKYKEASKLNPQDTSTDTSLARAYIMKFGKDSKQNFEDDLVRGLVNKIKNKVANDTGNITILISTKAAELYFQRGDSLRAYANKGHASRTQSDSIDYFTKAIKGYEDKAKEYRKNRKFPEAIEAYTHAINLPVADTIKARLYNSRGVTYLFAGNYQTAKEDYRHAGSLDSTWGRPLYNVSRVFVALGDSLREALRLAKLSVLKAPQNTLYQRNLIEIQGKLEPATAAKD